MSTVGSYAKAVVGALTAGLTTAITALADGNIDGVEWTVIAASVLVSAGAIFAVNNSPKMRYAKAITAGLLAAAAALGQAFTDGAGVSQAEWFGIVVALLSGAGLVATTPNAEYSDEFAGGV